MKKPSLLDELRTDPMAALEKSTREELAAVIARMRSERLGSMEWSRLLGAKGELVTQLKSIIASRHPSGELTSTLTLEELAAKARQIADACDAMAADAAMAPRPR